MLESLYHAGLYIVALQAAIDVDTNSGSLNLTWPLTVTNVPAESV